MAVGFDRNDGGGGGGDDGGLAFSFNGLDLDPVVLPRIGGLKRVGGRSKMVWFALLTQGCRVESIKEKGNIGMHIPHRRLYRDGVGAVVSLYFRLFFLDGEGFLSWS